MVPMTNALPQNILQCIGNTSLLALRNVRPGAIVLMHNARRTTIEALPTIVDRFEKAGYRFVTVGTLLSRVLRRMPESVDWNSCAAFPAQSAVHCA